MAIIKYRVEANITRTNDGDDCNVMGSVWQYEEIKAPDKKGKELSREQAMRRIKDDGLILVHKSKYGAVYDRPDEPLKEKYEGFYSRRKTIK